MVRVTIITGTRYIDSCRRSNKLSRRVTSAVTGDVMSSDVDDVLLISVISEVANPVDPMNSFYRGKFNCRNNAISSFSHRANEYFTTLFRFFNRARSLPL